MKLWRPVGLNELALIFEAEMRGFPPRLTGQPIFYPVLNRAYAEQIARDWNTREDPFAGYVTEFAIPDSYALRFERRVVGGQQHEELWVPAEDLHDFNLHIEERIDVPVAFFGKEFRGHVPENYGLGGCEADEQIRRLAGSRSYTPMDFYLETRANELTIFLNFPFWAASEACDLGLDTEELAETLVAIHRNWEIGDRIIPLIESGQRAA